LAITQVLNLTNMKKVWRLVALAFVVSASQAQDPAKSKTPDEKGSMKSNHLGKKQELTPDQQARLQPELLKTGLAIAQK